MVFFSNCKRFEQFTTQTNKSFTYQQSLSVGFEFVTDLCDRSSTLHVHLTTVMFSFDVFS